jgi:WhiB family redox-sensing transcriptional regulator
MRTNTIPKTCPPVAVWRASLSDNMMVSDTTDAPTELTHMTQISQTSIQGAPIMMTWRNRAACLDENPELFFPIGNTGPVLLQIEEAKAVCRRCEVMETCLEWAIESGQDAGVWGGMSEDERHALKRRTARARRARRAS